MQPSCEHCVSFNMSKTAKNCKTLQKTAKKLKLLTEKGKYQ